MKLYEQKATTKDSLAEVRCNICGKRIPKDAMGYLHDYVSVAKVWGYHSPFDGEGHQMDICAECYASWVRSFAIPPEQTEEVGVLLAM